MKLGYKWIREYVNIDRTAADVAQALTMSGTEVEEIIHEAIPRSVIAARIVEVKPHPDADKLKICMTDTGTETLQVVCGAPNCRPGMISAFAPIGTDLGQGMMVKKAKIRGVESFGVLVSERELGLTDDHTGIMEIESDLKPGDVLIDALDLEDWVFGINITPNRGDELSVIGIARELSAIFGAELRLPGSVIRESDKPVEDVLSVEILAKDACPRYAARVIEDVNIRKSPFTMRRRLFQAGVRAINNIVDITNYVMLEYGQPLHAFDYTFLAGSGIVVRKATAGEKFTTLDSVERTLRDVDLLICDREKPVALAGVMGGENSEVLDTTKTIALESAFFDPIGIRRTSKGLGLATEASYRFERGIDPAVQADAATRAAYLMQELADARVLKGVIDANYYGYAAEPITLRRSYIERVLGISDFTDEDVSGILSRLGFTLRKIDAGWEVTRPALRHDVTREIDLVEEFIRVYGMDKIEPELPTFKPMAAPSEGVSFNELRTRLSAMGYQEVVNYSFISPRFRQFFGEDALELMNPISDEMKVMRTSIIPGLATTIARNKNLQRRDISIFEVGICFYPKGKGELPDERQRLGVAISGQRQDTHWSLRAQEVDFYDIKGLVEALLPGITLKPSAHAFYKPGHQADVLLDSEVVGHLGALSSDILAMLDIADDVYAAELDAYALLGRKWKGITEIPKFPMTWRDLSLVADEGVVYAEITRVIGSLGIRELRSVVPVDLYTGEKLPQGKKGVTIRLTYQSDTRTLEDSTIHKWQDRIVQSLEKELGITLRQ
ncbi:MAG TPA: phenylalanine--tRNA ligase subunit beta [Deltaproteobacteria bacterium]|nr:phenylalanine--tRNA ligase subunit beta [Deltaproteobacteria bacterium]HOI06640.1 phenylalanine--tRNA ligase subunit beta [Deltaproteobacteria bacterium]